MARFSACATELRFESIVAVEHSPQTNSSLEGARRNLSLHLWRGREAGPRPASNAINPILRTRSASGRRGFLPADAPIGNFELLARHPHGIRAGFRYQRREAKGIQTPEETLRHRPGQLPRFRDADDRGGARARFRGALCVRLSRRRPWTIRPAGSTHAWAQVYLPGAGWIDFDPTSGTVGTASLVTVAVVHDPHHALPLHGTYFGGAIGPSRHGCPSPRDHRRAGRREHRGGRMKIRVGYELIYDFPQPTPMIMVLGIHFTPGVRCDRARSPDHQPSVPISPYRDGFGNWCSRIVAPAGRMRLSADGVVRDSGLPDVIAVSANQHRVEDLPAETLVFLLGSRYCETDRLSEVAWNLFEKTQARMGARPGDLRFRPSPHHFRLRACAPDHDGLGGLHRRQGRVPRLRPSRHHVLPLHEHSGALLHRLSRRHRHAAALWPDGFRRLVRGLSRTGGGTHSTRATTCRESAAC